jgi:hypothetical protein
MGNIRNIPSVTPGDKCYLCSQNERRKRSGTYYGWDSVDLIISQVRDSGVPDSARVYSIQNAFSKMCRRKKFAIYNALFDYLTPYGRETLFRGWVPNPNREPEPDRVSEPGTLAGWV